MTSLLLLCFGATALAADVKVTDASGERLYVFVNGQERGQTPLTVKLPPGEHTISVKSVPYLAANISYSFEVTDEVASGALKFDWAYERAEFAWGKDPLQLVVGQGAVAGGSGANGGVRGGSTSTTGRTESTTSGGSTSSGNTSSNSSSGNTSSNSSSGNTSSGSTGTTAENNGGNTSSTSSGSTSSTSSGSTSSSGGGSTSGGGSSTNNQTTSATGGNSSAGSSGGSSSGGSSSGGQGSEVTHIALAPPSAGTKVLVAPFDEHMSIELPGEAGPVNLAADGGEYAVSGTGEMYVRLGDKSLRTPVATLDGTVLALPWGAQFTSEGRTYTLLFPSDQLTQDIDLKIDLPEPMGERVRVVGTVSGTPGAVTNTHLDMSLHPAVSMYEPLMAAEAYKKKKAGGAGAVIGTGVALGLVGVGAYVKADDVYGQYLDAKDSLNPAEFNRADTLRRNALVLRYGGQGGVALGGVLGIVGVVKRATGGREAVAAYEHAESAYKEALDVPVMLEEVSE